MNHNEKKFTWVQTHKELTQYLSEKENDQKELIELLKSAGVTAGLVDEDPKGNRIDLERIDPFSFFCFIYKYGPEKRLKILQAIAKQLDLHYPEDELGIPSAQAQLVMMFPFRYHRNENEIEHLWHFFYSALEDSITDDQFEKILNQHGVGPVKITEVLFYIAPDRYMPINGPVKPWLKQELGIDPSFSSFTEYLDLLNKIKQTTSKPFYALSHDGWLWTEKQKKKDAFRENFEPLITRYKHYLEEFGLEKEQYKWEAIHHFQQIFDIDAEDFTDNLKNAISKAANLVYQNSIGFMRKAVEFYPEDVREIFRLLYNEEVGLDTRFRQFTDAAENLLPRVIEKYGKKLNHQQDERTFSYYLTMRFPEKYPLYKNETYKYLLSIMGGFEARSVGEKYFHYLELTDNLVFAVESEDELIKMVESILTDECYQGEQKWIVLQDILWINMRFINQANYWLFQGNPEVFDLKQALKDEALSTWRVNAHKSRITPGDKVILWAAGEDGGCYALAEVISEVYEDSVHEDEIKYYKKDLNEESYDQVQLQITHNLADNPIAQNRVKSDSRLEDLKIGNQGTNFSASEEEFEAIMELADQQDEDPKWMRLQKTVETIDDETAIRKFFKSLIYLIGKLNLEVGQPNVYCAAVDYYIHLTLGGKYLIFVQSKKGELELTFHVPRGELETLQSKYPELKYSDGYKDQSSDTVFVKFNPEKVNISDVLDVTVEAGLGLKKKYTKSNYRKIYPEVNNPWIFKVAQDDSLLEKLLNGQRPVYTVTDMKEITTNYPLNTIFYGPPGTGKTYNTIHRAAEIVENRTIDNYEEAKNIFHEHLHKEIEFITFHQNYSYEDFIQGLRPDLEDGNQLSFKRSTGVFKRLADKALKNYTESRKAPKELSEKKAFEEALETLKEQILDSEDKVRINETAYFIGVEDDAFRYSADNWTLGGKGFNGFRMKYSDLMQFFESNVRERSDIKDLNDVSGLAKQHASYFFKTYEIIRDLMPDTQTISASVQKKNYVLVIDEINRANISRVFGELITLIEPDKRYGREHHIPAKLPSGDSFSVPENLYIIGTMNTADKSIALLDIALRRRFEFEAMYPKYQISGAVIHDVDVLEKLNEKIINKKGHDFQIGHSYFMNNHISLKERMNRKVTPLLLEYFMNDKKEVEEILTYAGLNIEENCWPIRITGRA